MPHHYVSNWLRVNPRISAYNRAADMLNQSAGDFYRDYQSTTNHDAAWWAAHGIGPIQGTAGQNGEYDPADVSGSGSPQDYVPPFSEVDSTPPPTDYTPAVAEPTPQLPFRSNPTVQSPPDIVEQPSAIPDIRIERPDVVKVTDLPREKPNLGMLSPNLILRTGNAGLNGLGIIQIANPDQSKGTNFGNFQLQSQPAPDPQMMKYIKLR